MFPLIAGLAGSAARKLIPRMGGAIGRTVSRAVGIARPHPVATGVVTTVATGGFGAGSGGPPPPPPPGGRQPHGVVRRTIQRVLPGGRSGRELMPYEGTEFDKIGRPIAVHAEMIERAYVPPGYVVVDMPDGERIGVLRNVARSMGLWRPRPKPPITAGDARAIRRANSARKRVKKLAGAVGFSVNNKGRGFKRFAKKAR